MMLFHNNILKSSICLILVISLFGLAFAQGSVPCDLKETQYGGVCVCSATYCDYLENPSLENDADFAIVSSSKAGLRFATTKGNFKLFKKYYISDYAQSLPEFSVDPISVMEEKVNRATPTRYVTLAVNRTVHLQKIVGFGGSMTGAVSYLLEKMPQELQDHIYKSYYAKDGIAFNLMRKSIGGCDFDVAPWAYNLLPENDTLLSNFTKLDPRDVLKVEQIKRLKEVSNLIDLKIKAAAWSSPPWMKSNNKWTGKSHLKTEYYQTWADYHLKYLELMEENGLPIWAISTGNEPMNGVLFMAFVKFMSLGWTPSNQAIWLADYLGPLLRNSKYKDIVIFGNDDQRYTIPSWFNMMNSTRSNSLDYIDGLAVHWYWDEIFRPFFIDNTLEQIKGKILLNSESCIGDKPWQAAAPLLGSWSRGEKFARGFLQDLQHGFNGWIDWNIILDEKGGPNYVDNTVDAPLIVNTTTFGEVYKQPMFYTMGHFSKFMPEHSVRIESERSNINIDSVAVQQPDGSISVVLFNSGNANVEVNLDDSIRGIIIINVPPRSIHTVLYK